MYEDDTRKLVSTYVWYTCKYVYLRVGPCRCICVHVHVCLRVGRHECVTKVVDKKPRWCVYGYRYVYVRVCPCIYPYVQVSPHVYPCGDVHVCVT